MRKLWQWFKNNKWAWFLPAVPVVFLFRGILGSFLWAERTAARRPVYRTDTQRLAEKDRIRAHAKDHREKVAEAGKSMREKLHAKFGRKDK